MNDNKRPTNNVLAGTFDQEVARALAGTREGEVWTALRLGADLAKELDARQPGPRPRCVVVWMEPSGVWRYATSDSAPHAFRHSYG
jgi:hypothetical protein